MSQMLAHSSSAIVPSRCTVSVSQVFQTSMAFLSSESVVA